MMKRLLALLGIDARVQRVRSSVGEGMIAAEDRAQLVRMAWDDEKHRLRRLMGLGVILAGLTIVAAVVLSCAVMVHYWDSPQRATAAWLVAGFWLLLWLGTLVLLLSTLRGTSEALESARRELGRDWDWLQRRFADDEHKPREPRPLTRQQLLDRIERQRQRLALEERLEAVAAAQAEAQRQQAASSESPGARAVRIAREHPVAASAAAAVVLVAVGPRRLARWAGWVLPILWKLR